jgi:hypothetical protein
VDGSRNLSNDVIRAVHVRQDRDGVGTWARGSIEDALFEEAFIPSRSRVGGCERNQRRG